MVEMVIKGEVGNGVDMGEEVASLEQYSMESPKSDKDGKEVEKVWYSAMDCWSSGICTLFLVGCCFHRIKCRHMLTTNKN